ncbi:MAG: hypothetical protein JWN24_3833 [Phycisphaerales bacterium]|nr:hypothetical protein [Phycisphaerales bacterium]
MSRRRRAIGFPSVIAAVLLASAALASASPPVLKSAVSRKAHGTAGTFDVQLPADGSGIECRSSGTAPLSLVLTFDQPITGGAAAVTAGVVPNAPATAISTNTMTVSFVGAPTDNQSITVTVSNVTNAGNETLPSATVSFWLLLGDVNADGGVSAADVNICKTRVGLTVDGSTFRADVKAAGGISAASINTIKVNVGNVTGSGPTTNTPPTISSISAQTAVTGLPSTPTGFTVGDAESDPSTLAVLGSSSDQTTVPNSSISITGSGAARTVTITPAAGITTVIPVTITLIVSDGLATTSTTFTLTVTPPPTVYLATLQPIAGTNSLGSGIATLSVSGDQTYALLKYSFSNLAGADTDDQIFAPGDQSLYDVPVLNAPRGPVLPDGSIKWTFTPATAAATLAAIQANTSYIIIDSSAFPGGELKGIFQKVNGSQTFTPPPPPPAITINPPSPSDASRFLQQAGFGGMGSEITALSNTNAANANTALNDWLTQQFASPKPIYPDYSASINTPTAPLGPQSTTQPYSASSMYYQIYLRVTTPQAPNVYGDTLSDDRVHEAWWKNAVTAPDQLRQRVATALSEIFVVSEINDATDGQIPGLATYYDMLADDAFGNFRTLLGDVTLHPIMGDYLNMKGNKKATPPASPNENYAREIMQLFTIGLYMLQPDGTLLLDQNGQPIPTYNQTTITNFAQVFTGWDQNNTPVTIPQLVSNGATPPVAVVQNFNSYYQRPMLVNYTNHSTTAKTLLSYPGAATFPGATQPGFIPANTSQSYASANAELNFALDNIFNHPNTGPFICKQLIQRLVGSNPSPAYVYRVAQVFNNDGAGARGNLQAVITAILTDYEARSPALLNIPGYGHSREPMIRMAQIMRSLNATSKSGKWQIGKTDNTLAQTIFRAPTVFNFFDPHFAQPGVVQQAGLVSPELDIIYETTITNAQNMVYTGVYANYNTDGSPKLTGTGFKGDNYGSDAYLDFSTGGSGLVSYLQTNGIDALIDQVGLLLMGTTPAGGSNPMDPAMHTRIKTFVSNTAYIGATDYVGKVKAVVHLVATAAQCATQK